MCRPSVHFGSLSAESLFKTPATSQIIPAPFSYLLPTPFPSTTLTQIQIAKPHQADMMDCCLYLLKITSMDLRWLIKLGYLLYKQEDLSLDLQDLHRNHGSVDRNCVL